ncbi:mitochondrial glycoprotein family protein [Striga asiatica]|uniref:Mitochondrial glycoprotein family protein n=1 Tax=Striga asiatica TaxID=4170 RepID=A0A5A7R8W4_STRAF|nr:mitochondrial glycoprotein family protein [Striga asiatica]
MKPPLLELQIPCSNIGPKTNSHFLSRSGCGIRRQSKLVHHPLGFGAFSGATTSGPEYMGLSIPVAFQNPEPVTLLGLTLRSTTLCLSHLNLSILKKIKNINLLDELNSYRLLFDFSPKIKPYKLFVCRVKTKTRKWDSLVFFFFSSSLHHIFHFHYGY